MKFKDYLKESKSKEASMVLQLMDKDVNYEEAVKEVVEKTKCDKSKLEKELDQYI